MDGNFITSSVSSETLADVIAALVTARSHRSLAPHEESLNFEACREMSARLAETAAKRGPVALPPMPTGGEGYEHAGVNCPPPFPTGPTIPPGWYQLKVGDKKHPADMKHDGKKFVYVQPSDCSLPVMQGELIIRARIGG